jgi:tryptophanyl-tRNA synthetase
MKEIFLTGVKPTGTPHIGNYFGAIKPALDLANSLDNVAASYFFIANYHALNQIETKRELIDHTYEVACTWLACGLDPKKIIFYRQSDITETFELASVLSNVAPKGLLNRAHAYKAMVDKNKENNEDPDSGVNMGLFNYPVLMAADILLFNATKVPVGQDQKQHIEITRDIADYFNKRYGKNLSLVDGVISKEVATVIGLDGRKMSKSYNNTIPLFVSEPQLKKLVNRIVTDSKNIDEPKGTDNTVYEFYKLFVNENELKTFAKKLNSGISWGEAKTILFEKMNETLKPMREKYEYYMANRNLVDEILLSGAKQARPVAQETIKRIRHAIGVE